MLERLPLSVYVKDEGARHVRVSQDQVDPPIETDDGNLLTEPDEFVGKTDRDIYAPNLARESYQDDIRVVETGKPVVDKIERYETRFGETRWTRTSKVPWVGEMDGIKGLIGVTIDVTAEKRHEREIERQRERLAEFASAVAHDLRNPLSVARGYLDIARDRTDVAELDDVDQSLGRMDRIIEDVLALARQGKDSVELTPISLEMVARTAWKQVETADGTLRITDDCEFRADRTRLLQLIENLFRNAIEHAGEDVTITVEPLADSPGFAIEDDGPGIPEDQRDTVFESGYTTSADGTGFGLAIVEGIAEAHDWTVSVTEGDDGGARFEITDVDPRI